MRLGLTVGIGVALFLCLHAWAAVAQTAYAVIDDIHFDIDLDTLTPREEQMRAFNRGLVELSLRGIFPPSDAARCYTGPDICEDADWVLTSSGLSRPDGPASVIFFISAVNAAVAVLVCTRMMLGHARPEVAANTSDEAQMVSLST